MCSAFDLSLSNHAISDGLTTVDKTNNNSSIDHNVSENMNSNDDLNSQGISIENASYIENNLESENKLNNSFTHEEHTPKLFSENNNEEVENEDLKNDRLFDQDSNDDEEFEIPAFLRKQKF